MAYSDKYETYLEEIPADIEKCKKTGRRHLFGYTSNYDIVLKFNTDVYNKILEDFLVDDPAAQPGDTVASMEDFARVTSFCLMNGGGANFDITNVDVCDYLIGHFENEKALGGSGAQGAAAMGTIGFPMAIHITDRCREVSSMIDVSDMRVVKGDELVPVMEGASDEPPVYHIILQYSKDDEIIVRGKKYRMDSSNRLIFFYDKLQKIVPIDRCFFDYWNEHADDVMSYLIAGFDAVTDMDIINERLDEICEHIGKMRKKNPHFFLYLEGAYYMNPEIKEAVFRKLGPYTDIMGTNDEELVEQNERYGIHTDVTDIRSVVEGVNAMCERYGGKGVVIHTKDYAMYCGEELVGVDIEKGLTMGNLMACTRARKGGYGTYDECRESLSCGLSEEGLRFYDELETLDLSKKAVLVPAKYMEHPRYTVGLGDTFISGVQICLDRT